MTGVFIRREKFGHKNRVTKRDHVAMRQRSINPGALSMAGTEAWDKFSLKASRRNAAHTLISDPDSRTVRVSTSVVLNHPVCRPLLWQP